MQIHKHIKYSNTNQTLNVYSPQMRRSNNTQVPIVLLIHGGGFVAFDNTRVEPIAYQLAEIGCVVVTPNYRKLGPNIYITDALDDILDAFFWTKVYGQTYGGNPNKMFVMGVSGGGVLAALVTNTRKKNRIQAYLGQP
jgi:acetyl esterase/lipase